MADRLRVEPEPSRRRDALADVFCAACGTRLVVGLRFDIERAVELAERNATARPCCSAWGESEGGELPGQEAFPGMASAPPFFKGGV